MYTEYKPANYLTEEKQSAGFFIDIIREVFEKRLSIPLSIQIFPWPRCQNMIEMGEADMMMTIPTNERLDYALAVDPPIWVKEYMIYTWAGNPELERLNNINCLEALKKERISVLSYLGNSWSDTKLKPAGITVLDSNTVDGMYRMLRAQRGQVIIEDPILVEPALKNLNLADYIVPTKGIVETSSFHILISKKSPYAGRITEISRVLTDMMNDGTIRNIMNHYKNGY